MTGRTVTDHGVVRAERLASAAPALLRQIIREHGSARLRATGSSMLPSIRPGDVLTVRRCTAPHVRPGQVVLVIRGDRLIAHRVIRVHDSTGAGMMTLRGDAHRHCDPDVPASDLLGYIETVERNGSSVAPPACTWARHTIGIVLKECMALARGLRTVLRRPPETHAH